MAPRVLILLGSESDRERATGVREVLEGQGVPFREEVASAHRDLDRVRELARGAADEGIEVIIAAAGLSAHLPGVVASQTVLPVIGLPLAVGPLNGLDALFSIAQMPPGVPVATVGIGAAANAAYLALRILRAASSSPSHGA